MGGVFNGHLIALVIVCFQRINVGASDPEITAYKDQNWLDPDADPDLRRPVVGLSHLVVATRISLRTAPVWITSTRSALNPGLAIVWQVTD